MEPPRPSRSVVLLAVLSLAGCGDSPTEIPNGGVVAGVDMVALFAPPTSAERILVEGEWAARHPGVDGVREEHQGQVQVGTRAASVRILSHLVDGHRHLGAIVQPAETPSASLPVLVYSHGGDRGVSLQEVSLVLTSLDLAPDDLVVVVPSFRSEPLEFGELSWQSRGPASPWDRDVDDALALVEVALATTPFADPERIGVLGLSRGGAVGLLMGIRDERIGAVVSFFAPTDFFGPFVEEVTRETLLGRPPALPGLNVLAAEILEPLRSGELTIDQVRLELLRRSAARFADRLPAVQIHHGTADDVVPVEEAEQLIGAMEALGRDPPEFDSHIYPGAGHTPLEMPQSIPRTRSFLSVFLEMESGLLLAP